jgi:hypothetical protein
VFGNEIKGIPSGCAEKYPGIVDDVTVVTFMVSVGSFRLDEGRRRTTPR